MTTLETLLNDPDTAGVWNLVPDRSTFGFRIKNLWGLMRVKGRFTDVSGDGQLTGNGAVSGRLDIEVASLDTGIGRRDKHLLSPDFFDAERFPQLSVVITAVQPTKGNQADLQADFTIKGITEPVPLPVTVNVLGDGSVRIVAKTDIDLAKFGLDWNRVGMVGRAATAAVDVCFVHAG